MARLSKEALGQSSRFQFQDQEVKLPELGTKDGSVLVRSINVEADAALSEIRGKKPKPLDWMAAVFAAIVVEPKVTAEEAKAFLPNWPQAALERLMAKYSEMSGKEDEAQASTEFQGSD